MTHDEGYLLSNQQVEAGTRFGALSELFDPVTFRHLAAVGVAPGWACWEVGAEVPRWLAAQVGESGRVLATDIDTAWMQGEDAGFEVLRHDMGVDEAPAGPFDLLHARLLLVHLPRRAEVVRSLVDALRPGGWLVIEDADPMLQPLICLDEYGPAQRLANRLQAAFRSLLVARGAGVADSDGATGPGPVGGGGARQRVRDRGAPERRRQREAGSRYRSADLGVGTQAATFVSGLG